MGYDMGKRRIMGMARGTTSIPNSAMVLAAGLGTRMRPYNGHLPKPLVEVGGKALIDYSLDRLAEAGVSRAVINVHHLADALVQHLTARKHPQIVISDERAELLGTGGGIAKALPQLGGAPFFLVNSDTLWLDGVRPNFLRLAETFDPANMDALLLLAPTAGSIGYSGRGDFAMLPDGRLRRRAEKEVVPFVYAGAAVLSPELFADVPAGAFSLTRMFDAATDKDRLFGLRLEGVWMHVGTPEAVAAAEAAHAKLFSRAFRVTKRNEPVMPSRVFNIPASAPFLPTLLDALRNGKLGFRIADDPLAWAAATLYLPTRRACRLARDAFLDVMETDAAILPRIVALGDIDEDEIAFAEAATGEIAADALALPPTLDGLERRLLLTELAGKRADAPRVARRKRRSAGRADAGCGLRACR